MSVDLNKEAGERIFITWREDNVDLVIIFEGVELAEKRLNDLIKKEKDPENKGCVRSIIKGELLDYEIVDTVAKIKLG